MSATGSVPTAKGKGSRPEILPRVDVFSLPYENWETREKTIEEIAETSSRHPVRVRLLSTISCGRAAAEHQLQGKTDRGLEDHIEDLLKNSDALRSCLRAMPGRTPVELLNYQKEYENADLAAVAQAVKATGGLLSEGQQLFHGGLWSDFVSPTTKPLSTSFCPAVAYNNAHYRGKARDAKRLDLIVLTVVDPKTPAFVFKQRGTRQGHEKEVLFAPGACLSFQNEHRYGEIAVQGVLVELFVVEVDIS